MNTIRIFLSIVLLFCSIGSLFLFAAANNALKKIINLIIAYNSAIFFMVYNIFMQGKETYLIEFLLMIFIAFLLNIATSINIINNIMKSKENE